MSINILCTLILLVFINITTSSADGDDLIVTLPYGKIKGHVLRSGNNNEYYAYQEIPYASPPVGELRFKGPVAPSNWDEILETTKNTKICHQKNIIFPTPDVTETEDCLYLNVYTPQNPSESPKELLSVFVWIHGGGFVNGDGTFQQYGPKYFMDYGIVVVSINYRLGPLGFLTTNDDVIPGSIGLRDQVFALKWIQENIKLFGGDPEKVTIGGESAGAFSVSYLLLTEQSKGLFRAAIQESGSALSPYGPLYGNIYRTIAFEVGKALDPSFSSDDSTDLLNLLRDKSAEDITNADITLPTDSVDLTWSPVIEDGEREDALLTGPIHEYFKDGKFIQVPVLLGFNSEEYILLALIDIPGMQQKAKDYDEDETKIVHFTFNMTQQNEKIASSELKKMYTDKTFQEDFGSLVRFMSDFHFTTPVIRQAYLQSQYTEAYLYEMSYKGVLLGMNLTLDGVDPSSVSHGEELTYIWDTTMGDETSSEFQPPEADILTRKRLLTMWSNFIKYLNPTPAEDDLLQNVTWTKVSSNDIEYLNINGTLEVKTNPKLYKKWAEVIDSYAIPPLNTY